MSSAQEPGAVLVVGGRVGPGDVAGLCARLHAALEDERVEVVVCDVGAVVRPDAATIHALARLQLTARRRGARIRLARASPELRELLAFAGLADVVPAGPLLRLQAVRQPEEREQALGVEERVEPHDPAA